MSISKYKEILKQAVRAARSIVYAFNGFVYDFTRYVKYGGWRTTGAGKRDYRAVKIYHRLEKSLSFRNRRPGSGVEALTSLSKLFRENGFNTENLGYQERVGIKVMGDFLDKIESEDPSVEEARQLFRELELLKAEEGGVLTYSESKLLAGKLENPENFFMSRYSVRDFKSIAVDCSLIRYAIKMAMKSPSVCSRQAWHVYHIEQRELIDHALKFQNGNSGFGHQIPCLLILAVDLNAFDTASERYQHWIDGGMFSMSMILALHSIGLGSCCLNWSKGPIDDIRIRKELKINNSHTILMMLGVGYAKEDFKVCFSARRSVDEIYTLLD